MGTSTSFEHDNWIGFERSDHINGGYIISSHGDKIADFILQSRGSISITTNESMVCQALPRDGILIDSVKFSNYGFFDYNPFRGYKSSIYETNIGPVEIKKSQNQPFWKIKFYDIFLSKQKSGLVDLSHAHAIKLPIQIKYSSILPLYFVCCIGAQFYDYLYGLD